jgi:hypothetical protein
MSGLSRLSYLIDLCYWPLDISATDPTVKLFAGLILIPFNFYCCYRTFKYHGWFPFTKDDKQKQ